MSGQSTIRLINDHILILQLVNTTVHRRLLYIRQYCHKQLSTDWPEGLLLSFSSYDYTTECKRRSEHKNTDVLSTLLIGLNIKLDNREEDKDINTV